MPGPLATSSLPALCDQLIAAAGEGFVTPQHRAELAVAVRELSAMPGEWGSCFVLQAALHCLQAAAGEAAADSRVDALREAIAQLRIARELAAGTAQ